MRLYAGSSADFISDTVHNRIADKLKDAYFVSYRRAASPPEVNSWKNSLRAVAQVFQVGRLDDHGVLLEYELPLSSKRLDCIVTGKNKERRDNAVIIELKQWETCEEGAGDKLVTFTGGDLRDVLHPSAQVGQYKMYLEDTHPAFHEGDSPIHLHACSYLHNYVASAPDALFAPKFASLISAFPIFGADDVHNLVALLRSNLDHGRGQEALDRIARGKYRPSKKLLAHVAQVLKGKSEYVLLDEQLVAFERVFAEAKLSHTDRRKAAIIVRGGPGTGKSVIALNLLAALSKEGLNTHYATGSRAFTNTLRKIVGKRASAQMTFFNGYMQCEVDAIDVLLCDEAHRIRETSNDRYTPREKRSDLNQMEELFRAAKVAVFFIDDKQVVRPGEIGSAQTLADAATKNGYRVFDYKLEAQFRCGGSEGFINWISNTLEIERTPNVLWNAADRFDFSIAASPVELEAKIIEKLGSGTTARITAGFCWPWSDPQTDGTLVDDVAIGPFRRAWNAKPDAKRLSKTIPPSNLWAHDPRGAAQVGCVYTAQGFEFDYVGVIFGKDLVYRYGSGWQGNPEASFDTVVKKGKGCFLELVKNTYRVLLTRGIKGCCVFFEDKETEAFFRSRMEGQPLEYVHAVETNPMAAEDPQLAWPRSLPDRVREVDGRFADDRRAYTAKSIAAVFAGAKENDVLEILETLVVLGRLEKGPIPGSFIRANT